jgi:hypothetical protein
MIPTATPQQKEGPARRKLPKSFYGLDASARALNIRRRLTKREALVHEVVIATCAGWDRVTSIAELARKSGLPKSHVSEALTSLETLNILRRVWHGPKTSCVLHLLWSYSMIRNRSSVSSMHERRMTAGDVVFPNWELRRVTKLGTVLRPKLGTELLLNREQYSLWN